MIERSLTIENKLGLHARAATKLVELCRDYRCRIEIIIDGRVANAESVLGLLILAGSKGKLATVRCDGDDEDYALDAVCELIGNKFDEQE